MLLNCSVGEDSWESLGPRGDQTSILKEISPGYSLKGLMLKLKLKLQYFDHFMQRADALEKILMLEKIEAGGEGGNRGWDGWTASLTQCTWVCTSFGSWWWTRKPGGLQSMGLQRVGHDWMTELNWTQKIYYHKSPGRSAGKESNCNAEDPGSIPGLARSPAEENGYSFQYSCLENSMDRGAYQATVHGVTKSQTPLSNSLSHLPWNHS